MQPTSRSTPHRRSSYPPHASEAAVDRRRLHAVARRAQRLQVAAAVRSPSCEGPDVVHVDRCSLPASLADRHIAQHSGSDVLPLTAIPTLRRRGTTRIVCPLMQRAEARCREGSTASLVAGVQCARGHRGRISRSQSLGERSSGVTRDQMGTSALVAEPVRRERTVIRTTCEVPTVHQMPE